MNPYAIIGLILFWLASLLGAEQYGDHARGTKDSLAHQIEINAIQQSVIDEATMNSDTIAKLQGEKIERDNALNYLLDHPIGRVLVPVKNRCPNSQQGTGGSQLPDAGGQRSDDQTQQAFDRFRQELESDASDFSRAFSACKTVMDWAKAQ